MPPIKIDGVIGYEITSKDFIEKLEQASGDVDILINSPGGYVYDGVAIYNAIKNYDKGEVNITVSGLAASMASIVALSGKKPPKIESNSTFMIHNASSFAWGDYQVMFAEGDFLKKLSGVMADIYNKKTSIEDAQPLMDAETYFLGDDLKLFGDVIKEDHEDEDDSDEDNAQALIQRKTMAQMSVKAMLEKIKDMHPDLETIQSCKMLLAGYKPHEKTIKAEKTTNNVESKQKGKEKIMDLEQLKNENPDIYARAIEVGRKQGVQQEKERVAAHLEMMDVAPVTAIEAIKEGTEFSNAPLQAKYLKANINQNELTSMESQNPKNVLGEEKPTGEGEGEGEQETPEQKNAKAMRAHLVATGHIKENKEGK
jgi:ATP-dependent protease ClpP protease subunit